MSGARTWYLRLVMLCLVILLLAAIPIAASDLFREPYLPAWDTINRILARLRINYNPSGGGAPPVFPSWRDPGDAYLYYRDLVLTTADGVKLAAWYVPVYEPAAASILLCHGLLDSKWSMLRLVPWLHEAGYNVLLFDFRGHGMSEKRPTSLGRDEVADVQAALDWLEEQGAADYVGGLGMSLGAAALVNTASQDDRLDALVLDSLFAEWADVDYARDYRLPPEWLVPDVVNPVDLMPEIHVPVLIIHGTADILTHVDHAERLFGAADEPKQLWINDSGHAWSAWTYPDMYKKLVLAFLTEARP